MPAVELGTAYLTLAAETSDFSKAIVKSFKSAEGVASTSGKAMGKAISDGMSSASTSEITALQDKVKQKEDELASASEKAASRRKAANAQVQSAIASVQTAQEKASGASARVAQAEQAVNAARTNGNKAVEVAEMKLQELKDSGKAKSSQIAQAELNVSKARQSATGMVTNAESALQRAKSASNSASQGVVDAENNVTNARKNYLNVSREGIQTVSGYKAAVESSRGALDQARASTASAAGETAQASGAFSRLGGAIRSAFKGDFSGAFSTIKGEASSSASAVEGDFEGAASSSAGSFSRVGGALGGVKGDASSAASSVESEFGKSANSGASAITGKFSEAFKGLPGMISGFALGTTIGGALAAGITTSIDNARMNDRVAAQLNLTGPQAARAGKVAGNLYAGAYGDSMETVNDAVSAVMGSIKGMSNASQADIQKVTGYALNLSDAFGIDVSESVGAVGVMLNNGLAKDASQAFDYITGAMQQVPEQFRGELTDAINEYSKHFKGLGLNGEQAMNILVKGAENGTIGVDKMGDAVKEFQIRATDMSKSTTEAYDTLGLNSDDMTKRLLAGGDSAKVAFGEIITALKNVEDPSVQSQTALALFGTQLEDIGVDNIGTFLDAMDPAQKGMEGLGGSAEKMGNTLRDNAATKIESFKRTLAKGWNDAVGNMIVAMVDGVNAMKPFFGWLRDTSDWWGPFAAGIGLVAGAIGLYNVAVMTAGVLTSIWAGAVAVLTSPITLIIAGVGLLIGALILAYNKVGWFRDMVNGAWEGIKTGVGAFLSWWTESFWPGVMVVLQFLGDMFVWLWQSIIVPAWQGIMTAVGAFLTWWNESFWPVIQVAISALGTAFTWFYESIIKPVWTGIMVTITVIVAILMTLWQGIVWLFQNVLAPLFMWFWNSVIVPVWNGIAAAISFVWNSIIMPIWSAMTNFVNAILVPVFQWLGSLFSAVWNGIVAVLQWAWNAIIMPVWNAISAFINAVLVPVFNWLGSIFSAVWNAIVAVLQWAWNAIILPVWNAINAFINAVLVPVFNWLRSVFSAVWNAIVAVLQWAWYTIILPVWNAINAFINTVLVPVFNWLRSIFSMVWQAIVATMQWAWNVIILPIWNAIKAFIDTILVPVFNWLRDVIRGVWDAIAGKISSTWNWIRDVVLAPLANYLQTTFVDAWRRTKDMISSAWEKLSDAVKKPIKFVVDTVINKGFIDNYNKVNDFWNGKDLDKMRLGFHTGGYTGAGRKYQAAGVVHKDEYVIRKEATSKIRAKHGLNSLNYLNETGDLEGAYRMSAGDDKRKGSEHGIAAGPGSPTYAGLPSFGNPLQHAIARAGSLNVKGSVDGSWNLGGAANVWNGMAGVKVGTNLKGDVPTVHARQIGGAPWAGYYDTSGIQLNIGQGWADPGKSRPIVAAHEIGHALGLPHSMGTGGGASIMDYGTMYGLKGPTDKDAKALQSIYPGGSGKGGGDIGNGGGGLIDKLIDMFAKPVRELIKKQRAAFGEKNKFVDFPFGIATKMVDGVVEFAKEKLGSSDGEGGPVPEGSVKDWMTKALKMKNMFSESNLSLGVRRAMQESGGNAKAINKWDSNAMKGTPSKGLMQVIDPTFKSNMEPGHGDIWNPIDNILASINYTMREYGSLAAGWGRAGGYAQGGLVTGPTLFDGGGKLEKGVQFIDHQREKPDYVLTSDQWSAMYRIADRASNGNGPGVVVNGDIQGYTADEVARAIEVRRKQEEALYA